MSGFLNPTLSSNNQNLLFGRQVDIIVDTFEVSKLDCEFTIKKFLKRKHPNTCDLKIYNLQENARKSLAAKKTPTVLVKAGYQNNISQLFLGQVRFAYSYREGADIVTELTTADSEQIMATSRIQLTYGPNTPLGTVLNSIVKTLGVGIGNTSQIQAALNASGRTSLHLKGGVISGNAAVELDRFCQGAGLQWSVQDGQMQIQNLNKSVTEAAVLLNSNTGLIESPKIDNKHRVEVKALIIPGLKPGKQIQLDSQFIKGNYMIREITYRGNIRGQEWYAEMIASPLTLTELFGGLK